MLQLAGLLNTLLFFRQREQYHIDFPGVASEREPENQLLKRFRPVELRQAHLLRKTLRHRCATNETHLSEMEPATETRILHRVSLRGRLRLPSRVGSQGKK